MAPTDQRRDLAGAREALLRWYEPRRRAYPWRSTRDPYRVLVSEVMLQQTQASRVVPAYRAFCRRFPSVGALARAERRDVVTAWGGLGYNRRAVALSELARAVIRQREGRIPSDPDELRALPGVGPYTASAVASIAFGAPVAAVDTNVRRIVGRVFGGTEPHDPSPAQLAALAQGWLDPTDPGAWNQALMDLGREVCRPAPRCDACPIRSWCVFTRSGAEPSRPRRRQGAFEGSMRQVRGGVVRALRGSGAVSLRRLVSETGVDLERVAAAVTSLADDGLVRAGAAALAGEPAGRVRLA